MALELDRSGDGWLLRELPKPGVYDAKLLKRMRAVVDLVEASDLEHLDFGLVDKAYPDTTGGEYAERYGVEPALVNFLFYAQPARTNATILLHPTGSSISLIHSGSSDRFRSRHRDANSAKTRTAPHGPTLAHCCGRRVTQMMRVRFWGVRGSIAAAGPETAQVGGNTSCVEVRVGEPGSDGEALVIFDAGTVCAGSASRCAGRWRRTCS